MENSAMAYDEAAIDREETEVEALHYQNSQLRNKIHELEYEIKVLTEDLASLMHIGRRTLNKSLKTNDTLGQIKAENRSLSANVGYYREQCDKKIERINELELSMEPKPRDEEELREEEE